MTFKLNPYLKDFWRTKADIKVLKGGRSSGKTWDACAMLVFLAANYSVKVMCVRQFQANISDSVYTVIVEMIERMGYASEFTILKTEIHHNITGSSFIFFGFQKNTASIKGTEGVDVAFLEECDALTKEQWGIIEPTIRKEGSEIWLLYNPQLATDFVEKQFKHDPDNGVIVRLHNYLQNPCLSQKMQRVIAKAKEDDYEDYCHIYLGEPKVDDENVICKRKWLLACVDAHLKVKVKQGVMRIGFDVADDGDDLSSVTVADGNVVKYCEEWKAGEDQLFESAEKVFHMAREHGNAEIVYDSIGVGAGTGSNIKRLNDALPLGEFKVKATGLNYGAAVKNPKKRWDMHSTNEQYFSNLKAQVHWDFARKALNTYNAVTKGMEYPPDQLISLSSDIEDLDGLIDELSLQRKARSADDGKNRVESKKDLKKRGFASPNRNDSTLLSVTPFAGKGKMIVG